VADFNRIHWPICSRIAGRFISESLADLHRIMHPVGLLGLIALRQGLEELLGSLVDLGF